METSNDMHFQSPLTVAQIEQLTASSAKGDKDLLIKGINEIHQVQVGDLTFVDHPKYYDKVLASNASAILIDKDVEAPEGKVLFVCEDPFTAYNTLVNTNFPFQASKELISPSASVGKGTHIQPGTFIGENVVIGDNCLIHANVTINANTIIGNDVIIHSGAVIASDAFYFKTRKDPDSYYEKMHSCGIVVIEDQVEIGANCTIDRCVSKETRIGEGTIIDNMVHIGHGVVVGKNCLIASQTGISGNVIIGDEVAIWSQSGLTSNLKIGSKSTLLARTGVSKDLEGGKTYFGAPADEARTIWRQMAAIRQLPDLLQRLKKRS